jgi:hypothetical protein
MRNKILLTWLVLSLIFWLFYFSVIEVSYNLLYYFFIIFVGIPVWKYRNKIKDNLFNWKLNKFAKFFILGYGAVLFEEIFAALTNHLSEGFNFELYLQRIGQFWLFNILAFTGFYFAWYFLLRRYKYTHGEVFILSGVFGLFSEGVLFAVFSNPVAVFFMAPMVVVVYGLMITPSLWSIGLIGKKEISSIIKYPLSLLVIFLFSIIPLLILQALRIRYPWLFPPVEFIPMM